MKSARRQARIAKKKKDIKRPFSLYKFILPVVLVIFVIFLLRSGSHVWDGKNKVAVSYKVESGEVGITVMDPALSEITTLVIPRETQVDVARNLGVMRIKNVWQLGINEKIGGILLSETITKNFLFPVYLWGSSKTEALSGSNFGKVTSFVFFPGTTNISFRDRLSMGLYVLKIQDIGRTTIDLGKSQYLTKQKLNDGLMGYVYSGGTSGRLSAYFSDNQNLEESIRVRIVDATGVPGISEKVGEILEVVGGKVVSVDKKVQGEETDCEVFGASIKIIEKASKLFSCKITSEITTFDLEIRIGTRFAKRF